MRSPHRPFLVFLGSLLLVPVLVAGAPGSRPLTQRADLAKSGMKLRLPPDWKVGGPRFSNAEELHFVPTDGGRGARIMITTEPRLDHDDAVTRLRQIAEEANAPVVFLEIGGWPALQRRQWIDMPLPGKVRPPDGGEKILRITTAVAAGSTLVRLEATVPREREKELADEVEALSRTAVFALRGAPDAVEGALRRLREQVPAEQPEARAPRPTTPAAPVSGPVPADGPLVLEGEGAAVRALTGGAEIAVAVSNNGQNVVVATNSGYTVSSDAGVTFSALRFPTFPGTYFNVNGDPSLAVGQSGAFYYALIGFPTGVGTTATSNSTAISVSTDNGQNFAFRANAELCQGNTTPPAPGPGLCFADQEHIAADRWNAAPGGDQVYSTWRDFDGTDQDPALVCTQDSGTNWTAKINAGTGTKPRIGLGQDGFVYVVYLNGNNVEIRKYTSCSAGLALQVGFPQVVANIAEVTCPVPGLDRCTGRNTLASYTVAVDDTNANHVYVAFATNTANNVNENVIVRDSVNGGLSWPRQVQVNGGGNARRFMPWMCTLGGAAHVTWYDRRNATGGNNDLTDFFRGRAFVDAGNNLVAGAEVQLTQVSDPHCASGWPCPTDRISDAESCSVQPQPAGQCAATGVACDFSDCDTCTSGTCSVSGLACASNADCLRTPACACGANDGCVVGRGCPKYGDYNYSACAAGRIYSAWASASSPPGVVPATPANRIDTFMNVDLVCCVPRIDAPAALALPDTCAGDTSSAPLTVCNTGFTDLVVSGISSSNPSQFSVAGPFPATIAAGACQAFSVSFSPPSRGAKAATLTISSNDPVSPTKAAAASGQGKGIVSITCPVDLTVPNDPGLCSALVNTGVPTYEAEGCPVDITSVRSDGLPLAAPFPVGNTTVAWTATDGGGNAKACPQTIVVNDVEAPVIAGLAAVPNVLWPPNHKMVLVSVNYTATDNCDPTPACSLAVSSNEPVNGPGDGNTSPDWLVLDNHHARLRSERAGGGNGRIYTETVTCTDIYNNSKDAATTVKVPKSQGK